MDTMLRNVERKKQDGVDIKPVTLQDLMTEAKMVKQEIKEDNSTDINEQNIVEIINLKKLSKPMTDPLHQKKIFWIITTIDRIS